MNRLKKEWCSQILDGGLQWHKNHMTGTYQGFGVVIEPGNGQYILTVAAHLSGEEQNNGIKKFLQDQQREKKQITGILAESCEIKLSVSAQKKEKNVPELINSVLKPLMAYLVVNYYEAGCQNCGRKISFTNPCKTEDGYCFLCDDCRNGISRKVNEKNGVLEDFGWRESNLVFGASGILVSKMMPRTTNGKSNPALGLLGAVLGTLAGGLLWFVFFQLGFIAGLAGAVMVIGAVTGYQKLGGHLDKKGAVISILVTVLAIYLVNRFCWALEAYQEMKNYGAAFLDVFIYLEEWMNDSGWKIYYGSLATGYILTILVAACSSVWTIFRKSSENE